MSSETNLKTINNKNMNKTASKNPLNLKSSLKDLQSESDAKNTAGGSQRNRSPGSQKNTGKSSHKKHNKHISIGPLQVSLMDINDRYRKGVAINVCRVFVHCMVGAVNIVVLGYSIQTGDVHAVLCTLAWHFFATEAILVVTYTGILTQSHKKYSHMFLQMCGMLLGITGCVLIFLKVAPSEFKVHGIVGAVATIMHVMSFMSGPFMLQRHNRRVILFHTCLTLPTYAIFSACLILALLKPKLKDYAGIVVVYALIFFVAFYTIFISVIVILKACNRTRASSIFTI